MTDEPSKYHADIRNSNGIHIGDRYGLQVTRKIAMMVLASVAALVIAVTAVGYVLVQDSRNRAPGRSGQDPAGAPVLPSANAAAVPAPADAPPVLVSGITPMRTNEATRDFALPRPLRMSVAQLATFNKTVQLHSSEYSPWLAEHDGTAVDFGTTRFTVRGNARETVRIADMQVVKDCDAPLDGAYFRGYSQGSGDPLRIGFDLDAIDPVARQLAFTSGKGLFATDDHYFDIKTVTLAPGEQETFVVGAFTKMHSCTFRIRIFVATGAGTFYQDIDQNGRPFRVTAKAPPANGGAPLSGYRSAYVYLVPDNVHGSWQRVEPATFRQ